MTRIFSSGLETGNVIVDFPTIFNDVTIVSGSSLVRTGNYALKLANNGSARTGSIITGTAIYGGFSCMFTGSFGGLNGYIIETLDSAGSTLGAIKLITGPKFAAGRSTTVVATGTTIVALHEQMYLEYFISVDNSAGRIVLKVNGVTDIDFTGDTQPAGNSVIDSVRFISDNFNVVIHMDDIVINTPDGSVNNSYPGVVRLLPSYPNNSGTVTQLSRGGINTGQNYSQVNEVPYSANQYVYDNVVDEYDLYNIQDPSIPANAQIRNIILNAVSKVDSGTGNIALMVKSGAVESQSVDKVIGISDKSYQEVWNIDPSTSGTWSIASVNALQIGVKIR